ncbi:toxin C-terminal domain-containing protein [Aneurinibacillus migulanus]|uniref:toxin C-terminal domain-containing protein n=1 Tax=Aneurinibacillus migulanus TaxID=47500 RepID=UPI00128ED3A5|nr:toxin C-terminal domain-containing protein [Aneurinibacillus migulanus]
MIQNADKSNIVVYGPYDVFRVQGRTSPVTFVHTLTADQTIEFSNTLPQRLFLVLNGSYDYAQYNSQGGVKDFNFNSTNSSSSSIQQGDTMVISPTQGKTVTVSGVYDGGFEITNRSQRAVTIRTLQPAESYSFQNISPGGLEARISGVYDYQIFESSGKLLESGNKSNWALRGVGSTRKLVITNADKTPITVAVPTDAVQEANNPDVFTKWLSSGQSMEAKNTSNTPGTLTVNGKYDFVLYNAAGEPVSYERETSTATLSVPSGHRVVLTSRRAAGITVSGSASAFTRTDQSNPALVQAKVDKKAVLKAINLKDSAQTVKIEGSFTYRLDREKEQVGQSPLTVPAGKTAWIRNTSENEFWVYSPYDSFQLEVGEAESEVISGVRAAEQIRKLNLGDYDSQSFHADPVDTSTGAQIMNLTPLTAHGTMPVPFQAQYHSLLTGKGALGTGWSHNYEVRLEPDSSGNKVTVFWNAFRANTFKRGRDGLFSSDEQATKRDRLTKRSDGTFELKRNDGTVYHFTASGRLTQLQEKTGLKLVFGYSSEGKLTSVTEPLTHAALTLSYNAGRIAKVEDQAHRATSFAYDAAGRMIKMIDPAGQVTEYTYDGEDRIVTAVIEGVQLFKNEYDNEGRIVEQQDANHAPTKFAYAEAEGQLVTTITDRNGHTQKRIHDAKYKLLRVEDELGRKTTYTYDDEGNRTSETNALNQTVTYNYDAQGNVTDVTYPTGQHLTMNYDANNNLVKLTRADGSTILSTYDSQNRLLTVTDPEGSTTSYRYDGNGLLVSMLDPLGGETLYSYTGNRLTSMKNAAGETITFGYDSAGRMVSEKDENGNGTVQTYNADDQLASETDALGHTITYTYDTQGFLRRETDARGNASAYTYDGNGNVTQITNALNETTTLAYDKEGRLTSITDPLGNRTTYAYDAAGNLLTETNANGETVRYAYDELNRFIEAYGATGEKVYAVTYDAAGNPVTQTDALNHTQTNVFDQLNRLKQTTDPLQRTTSLQYDRLNRLTAVTDPLQGQASSSFDLLSRMTSVTDPNANTTAYTYDRVGRLTGEMNATGSGRTYQYNKIGQLEQEKNGRNQTTTYQYDKAGRVTQFTDPVGTVTYTYDANNNVTAVTDGNGKTLTRTFDKLNRVEQYTDEYGNTIQYTYDAAGNLKTVTYPDGKTVTYTYDAAGRMKTVTDWKNRVLTYEYDQNGRLISTRRPNGTVETRTYDAKGQLLSLTDKRADGSVIHAYTYTYDAVGNVVTEEDRKGSALTKIPNIDATTFTTKDTIDITGPGLSLNPLPVTDNPTAEKEGKSSVSTKMPNGNAAAFTTKDTLKVTGSGLSPNLLSVTDSLVTEERGKSSVAAKMSNANAATFTTKDTLDINGPGLSPNPLPVADGSGTKKGGKSSVANATMTYTADNRLATYNGHAVSYDADGNLISGPLNNAMQTYTYDARNRLIEVGDTRYGYNSEDIRTSVTTADSITIRYVVNPHTLFSQVLMETNDQNKPQAWYVYGLDLIGREDEVGQYQTYHYDRRGSTVALTDKNAQVTDTYTYGHYGEALEHQGETEQPFRYNGRDGVMTDANGLYYMRARYYNPEIKRFVNRDVMAGAIDYAQTLNRYAYVNGNPISYVDPFGLERIKSTYVAANPTYVASNSPVFIPQVTTKSIIRGLWNDLGDYGERKAKEKDWGISKDEAWFILQLTGGPRGGGVKSGGGAKPWVRMTTKEATAAAKKLGYEPTNHTTKNKQKIFYNKKTKTYISQDIGSADGSPPHKGGVWKMAKSPEALNRKETRMGTYDANLKRIGD